MTTNPEAKKAEIALREKVVKAGLWPCCINCEHWGEYMGVTDEERVYNHCTKYNRFPPEDVIVLGCPAHEPAIPF